MNGACDKCGWFPGALPSAAPLEGYCGEHTEDLVKAPKTPPEKDLAQFVTDTGELLRLPAFRRWVTRVLDHPDWCHVGGLVVDFKSHERTYFAAGSQALGIQLRSLLQEVSPGLYMRALNEQTKFRAALEGKAAPLPRDVATED